MAKAKLPVFTHSPHSFHLPPPLLANSPSILSLVLYWPCFLPLFPYSPNSALLLFCKIILQAHPCSRLLQTTLTFLIYSEKCCQNHLFLNALLATSFQRVTAGGLGREEGEREHCPQDLMAVGRGVLSCEGRLALLPGRGGISTFQGYWIRHWRHFSLPLGKGTQLVAETRSRSPLLQQGSPAPSVKSHLQVIQECCSSSLISAASAACVQALLHITDYFLHIWC